MVQWLSSFVFHTLIYWVIFEMSKNLIKYLFLHVKVKLTKAVWSGLREVKLHLNFFPIFEITWSFKKFRIKFEQNRVLMKILNPIKYASKDELENPDLLDFIKIDKIGMPSYLSATRMRIIVFLITDCPRLWWNKMREHSTICPKLVQQSFWLHCLSSSPQTTPITQKEEWGEFKNI